jgi:hypothetical protein
VEEDAFGLLSVLVDEKFVGGFGGDGTFLWIEEEKETDLKITRCEDGERFGDQIFSKFGYGDELVVKVLGNLTIDKVFL